MPECTHATDPLGQRVSIGSCRGLPDRSEPAPPARGEFLVALVAGAGRRRGRRRFPFWTLEIGGGGALRQQPLATAGRREAFGWARTLLDFGIGRARPLLKSARKGSALTICWSFPRAREGGRSASGFDPAAPASSNGVGFGTTGSKPLAEGICGVCALWHFRLVLMRGRAGAERHAANS